MAQPIPVPTHRATSERSLRRALLHDDDPTVRIDLLPGAKGSSLMLTLSYVGSQEGQVVVEGTVNGQRVVLRGNAPSASDRPLDLWIEQ